MEAGFNILTEVAGVLCGGGLGALIMQWYTAGVNKKKLKAEADAAKADAEKKKMDNRQDAFESVTQQLSKCMSDYSELLEKYRKHREEQLVYEDKLQEEIHSKCVELAELRSKVVYLKGLRCYETACLNRVRSNPDKETIVVDADEFPENGLDAADGVVKNNEE